LDEVRDAVGVQGHQDAIQVDAANAPAVVAAVRTEFTEHLTGQIIDIVRGFRANGFPGTAASGVVNSELSHKFNVSHITRCMHGVAKRS